MTTLREPDDSADRAALLDEGAKVASEILSSRLAGLRRPLPEADDPSALHEALMLRDSVDLTCRDVAAVTGFIERAARQMPALTQNERRKQIVPTIPSVVSLRRDTLAMAGVLGARSKPWTTEDACKDDLEPILGASFTDSFMGGRSSLLGVGSAQVELGRLLVGIHELESRFGSFHIWIKAPEKAMISSLQRSLLWHEPDAWGFMDDVLREHSSQSYVPETREEVRRYHSLRASAAEILLNQAGKATKEIITVQQLKLLATGRIRRRARIRPLELGGHSVSSTETLAEKRLKPIVTPLRTPRASARELIEALTPREVDRLYLQLKLVEGMPPREIREEFEARGIHLNDTDFRALQHRCNADLRRAREALQKVETRRPDNAIRVLRSIRHHH